MRKKTHRKKGNNAESDERDRKTDIDGKKQIGKYERERQLRKKLLKELDIHR